MPESANDRFQKDFDRERREDIEPTQIIDPGVPDQKDKVVQPLTKGQKIVEGVKKAGKVIGRGVVDGIQLPGKAVNVGAEIFEEINTSVSKSDSKIKKLIVWLASRGIPVAVIVTAIVWIRDKGIEILEKKAGTAFDFSPRSTEESQAVEASNTQIDFSLQGFDGTLNIEPLTDPQHGNDRSVIDLAAIEGGPAGLLKTFKTAINPDTSKPEVVFDQETGQPIMAINEVVFEDISTQLSLDQAGQVELRKIWSQYLDNPDTFDQNIFLNFLQQYGANPQVIEFYRYAMELKIQYPDTWQDRVEPLKNWEPKQEMPMDIHGENELAAEEVEPNENYFSTAEMAFKKIGSGDFGEAMGIIETAVRTDYSSPEFQTALALDIADLPDTKPQMSGFSPLPLVLTGIFLLRISPRIGLLSIPRKSIEAISDGINNAYYWFRMGQASRVVRDLMVIGSQFLKAIRTNSSGSNRQ